MRQIDDRARLQHMVDHVQEALDMAQHKSRADLDADRQFNLAIVRLLEIVGEASKRLSEDLRTANPTVPWRRVCGLRDVLIHNYMGVDLEAVWSVVEGRIPALKETVAKLLGD